MKEAEVLETHTQMHMQRWKMQQEMIDSMGEQELKAFIKGYLMAEHKLLKRMGSMSGKECGGSCGGRCGSGASCACGGKEGRGEGSCACGGKEGRGEGSCKCGNENCKKE